jgi:hypothetical protein
VGTAAFFVLTIAKPIKERGRAQKNERQKSESAKHERRKKRDFTLFPPSHIGSPVPEPTAA